MFKDSIKNLAEIAAKYTQVKSIEIFSDEGLIINYYNEKGLYEGEFKSFDSHEGVLEWIECNLK